MDMVFRVFDFNFVHLWQTMKKIFNVSLIIAFTLTCQVVMKLSIKSCLR